jgi:hypothetical protein
LISSSISPFKGFEKLGNDRKRKLGEYISFRATSLEKYLIVEKRPLGTCKKIPLFWFILNERYLLPEEGEIHSTTGLKPASPSSLNLQTANNCARIPEN